MGSRARPELGDALNGYAHTWTVSTPVSTVESRSAAQPATTIPSVLDEIVSLPPLGGRGRSITVCGPTRLLPFALSTTRTSCRATARPPDHRPNTRSYVPTKPTPGIQVNAPVEAFSEEPIGSGVRPPATRR